MKVLKNVNFNLKETINAESATTVLKNLAGQQFKINGLLVGAKEDTDQETGEVKEIKIGVLKTVDGELISSISPTVLNSIDTIITTYTDMGLIEDLKAGVDIIIKADKSAKGREFFHLELV